jgi:hypothetical protein
MALPRVASYDDLAELYGRVVELRRTAERRLRGLAPGSESGRRCYALLRELEAQEAELRRRVLAHPDAPPQG